MTTQNPVEKIQENVQEQTVSKKVRNYRAYLFQGYIYTVVIAFAIIATMAHFVPYFAVDLAITQHIQKFNPTWFDLLMHWVSWVGVMPQAAIIVLFMAWLLYIFGLRWESVMSVFAAVLASGLSVFFKTLVSRQRPSMDLVIVFQNLKDFSFPSGHVTLYTVFFGYLLFLSYSLIKRSPKRTFFMTIFGIIIMLVGPSRIYEGEHWASDVFAAYMIGSVILALIIYIYRWGKPKYFVNQPTAPAKTT